MDHHVCEHDHCAFCGKCLCKSEIKETDQLRLEAYGLERASESTTLSFMTARLVDNLEQHVVAVIRLNVFDAQGQPANTCPGCNGALLEHLLQCHKDRQEMLRVKLSAMNLLNSPGGQIPS